MHWQVLLWPGAGLEPKAVTVHWMLPAESAVTQVVPVPNLTFPVQLQAAFCPEQYVLGHLFRLVLPRHHVSPEPDRAHH